MMRRTVTMQLCRLLLCVLLLSGKTGAKRREPNLQHYQNIHYNGMEDELREPSHQNILYTGMEDELREPSHQNILYTGMEDELSEPSHQNIHYTGMEDELREPSYQNIHHTGMEDDLSEPNHQNILYTKPQTKLRPRALQDIYPKGLIPPSSHKQLLGALQEVLEKLQAKKMPTWEKKLGQVPTCDVGEKCAVRKGSRIGRMCDCPRGALCNFYLLKCL